MKQYIVDAFTDRIFRGNQAAICVMDYWIPDDLMMNIAIENNFSETAFTVKTEGGYGLRWFTPGGEISLCGHATLAAAYVLFNYYEKDAEAIVFHTMSGDLFIGKRDNYVIMDFPAYHCNEVPVTEEMEKVMGCRPSEAYLDRDLLLVYEDESIVRSLNPDFERMKTLDGQCVGVTAPGHQYDCVS